MKQVKVGNKTALVDDGDFAIASQYTWSDSEGYAKTRINGKTVALHRLIMNPPAGMVVDHINGDTLDNRRTNLRICAIRGNAQNRRKQRGTKSKYKGVGWFKPTQQWTASITANGKSYALGYYDTQEEAGAAYNYAAHQLHGEFARLNEGLGMLPVNLTALNDRVTRSSTSGYRGVRPNKTFAGYRADIRVDSKLLFLGSFDNLIDAAKAYDAAALAYRGPKAKLNFPEL